MNHILTKRDNGIAWVMFNRPEKLNAITHETFDAIIAAGEALATDQSVRVVILAGEGRAFCAGLDTKSFQQAPQDLPPVEQRSHGIANQVQRAVMVWRDIPVPVIAVLHGAAIGAGLDIALAADLRFAHPATRLAIAEINWGFIPAMAGSLFLPSLMRDDVRRDLTYSGRTVLGEEAQRLGLVTQLSEDPRAAAVAFAEHILTRNPDAIRAAKKLFRQASAVDEARILALESQLQAGVIRAMVERGLKQ